VNQLRVASEKREIALRLAICPVCLGTVTVCDLVRPPDPIDGDSFLT
jgi:hypothetical protein